MRRLPTFAILPVLALAGFGGTACTDEGGNSLVILQNQVPDDGCVIPAERGEFRARGLIDVATNIGYLFTPVVQSRLTTTTGDPLQRTVAIQGAEVTVTSDAASDSFTANFSGSIDPDGGTASFAFETIPVNIIQSVGSGLGAGQQAEVLTEVKVFGTAQGNDVESDPFFYPVAVCNGCVTVDLGPCNTLPLGFEGEAGNSCNAYQDGQSYCCTADSGALVCPALGTAVTP